jgi:hypothetical protein
LKAARQKCHIIHKDKTIRVTTDFSTQTLKARRASNYVSQALKENNCQPRLLYPAKLSTHN